MEFCKATLTFESADEILWYDHSNESSLPVLSHGAICLSKVQKTKFGNLVEICLWPHLAVKGLITQIFVLFLVVLVSKPTGQIKETGEKDFICPSVQPVKPV